MAPQFQIGGESAREALVAHRDGKHGTVAVGHLGAEPGVGVRGFGLEACVVDFGEDAADYIVVVIVVVVIVWLETVM